LSDLVIFCLQEGNIYQSLVFMLVILLQQGGICIFSNGVIEICKQCSLASDIIHNGNTLLN